MPEQAMIYTAPDPGLASLWGRAIASDSDREAWLAARRTGLTGTDMKVIARGRPATVREHLRKKASGTDAEFRGNKATEWGNYREACIIEDLDGTEFHRCGLLLAAASNPQYIVTPDLMGVSFEGDLEAVEVKTSEKDLDPDGPDFKATRYLEQILWQMFVTDAARVHLYVEQHDGDWSRWNDRPQGGRDWQEGFTLADYGPRVLALHKYTFERVDYAEQIAEMVAKAEKALVVLAEELAGFVADGPEQFDEVQRREFGEAARRYAEGMAAEKAGKAAKDEAKRDLIELAESRKAFSETFDRVKVTYSPPAEGSEVEVPDEDTAREAEPEAWERVERAQAALTAARDQWQAVLATYTKTETSKPEAAKVTVTPPRGGIK